MNTGVGSFPRHDRVVQNPRHSAVFVVLGRCPEEILAAYQGVTNLFDVTEVALVCSDDAAHVAMAQQIGATLLPWSGDSQDFGSMRRLGLAAVTGDVIHLRTVSAGRNRPEPDPSTDWSARLEAARAVSPSKVG